MDCSCEIEESSGIVIRECDTCYYEGLDLYEDMCWDRYLLGFF